MSEPVKTLPPEDMYIDLSSVADGAAQELFNYELRKVLVNINDPNTDALAARSVTIKLTIKPDENREVLATHVEASSSLAKRKGVNTKLIAGTTRQGQPTAREFLSSKSAHTQQIIEASQVSPGGFNIL